MPAGAAGFGVRLGVSGAVAANHQERSRGGHHPKETAEEVLRDDHREEPSGEPTDRRAHFERHPEPHVGEAGADVDAPGGGRGGDDRDERRSDRDVDVEAKENGERGDHEDAAADPGDRAEAARDRADAERGRATSAR